MKKEVIAQQSPKSPISEIFRTLRTNIQFMNTKGKLKTLLVTSTLPGEGKSWVSSNLAVTFAQAGNKVVLVDADMRKGRQYSIFGVSPRPGLSNYLSGIGINGYEEEKLELIDFVQETEVENLYLIAAGNVPPNPSELLIAPQMVDLLEQLKDICDIVIIDGTPSQLVTDSLILTRLVDSTLIVTASKETKKEDLKRVINNIQNVGGKIAGVVINKMPISAKKYEDAYYYGSMSLTRVKNVKPKTRTNNNYRNVENLTSKKDNSNFVKKEIDNVQEMSKKYVSIDQHEDLPKSLIKDYREVNSTEATLDKTNDILKQINEYLDKEKQNLK